MLVDVAPAQDGEKVRRQMERWLTESLNERYTRRTWWTEAGDASTVNDDDALNAAYPEILRQRA